MRSFKDLVVIPTPCRLDNQWILNCLNSISDCVNWMDDLGVGFLVVLNDSHLVDQEDAVYISDLIADAAPWCELVVNSGDDRRFELGALRRALEWGSSYDRMLLLQDTFEIHSEDFFHRMFDQPGSISLNNQQQMYCLVYMVDMLKEMELPPCRNKHDSVRYEGEFVQEYVRRYNEKYTQPVEAAYGNVTDSGRIVQKFGRNNNLIQTPHFTKYKGTWGAAMIGKDNRGT